MTQAPPLVTMLETPHALPASEVVARLDVAPAVGLDDEEVKRASPPTARTPSWRGAA